MGWVDMLPLLLSGPALAAEPPPAPEPAAKKDPKWYEVLKLRGYTQIRHDNLPSGAVNPDLENPQGDRYIGGDQAFGIRRARLVLQGDVHPRVAIYLQTDFASVVSDSYHVPSMRDWYTDVWLTGDKALRVRLGQSKVPYGWENLQSSSNRLALDRADPLNSAFKDERDLGAFLYWSPAVFRDRFKMLLDENLKGSGDYGVVALGAFNGQGANKPDENGNLHVVARVSVPLEVGSQAFEVGTAAYTGFYRVSTEAFDDGTEPVPSDPDGDLLDRRVEGSFVWYPRPLGVQVEYNVGQGPTLSTDKVAIRSGLVHGGYAQLMAKIDHPFGTVAFFPYVRGQMYEGGKKFDKNAFAHHIREVEGGIEWQIVKPIELTLAYAFSDRTSASAPYGQEAGQLFRAQVQVNY